MSNVSEASICRVSVQFLWSVPLLEIKTLFVFFILQKHNVLLILWVHTNKTIFSSKWWRLYSYLKWGKTTAYFNFPLLLIKINARDLAGASMCPSTRASASTLRTNDLICITHLSYIYSVKCMVSNRVYLRRLNWSNSLSGRLIFYKKKLNKHKIYQSCF